MIHLFDPKTGEHHELVSTAVAPAESRCLTDIALIENERCAYIVENFRVLRMSLPEYLFSIKTKPPPPPSPPLRLFRSHTLA